MLISPEVLAAVLSFILTSVGAWFLAHAKSARLQLRLSPNLRRFLYLDE